MALLAVPSETHETGGRCWTFSHLDRVSCLAWLSEEGWLAIGTEEGCVSAIGTEEGWLAISRKEAWLAIGTEEGCVSAIGTEEGWLANNGLAQTDTARYVG